MSRAWHGVAFLFAAIALAQSGDDYAPEKENIVFKTQIGKQIAQEDIRCGEYFWRSDKADKRGTRSVYFFYGNPAYGKNRLGLYHLSQYKVVVTPDKNPPTVQVIRDAEGNLKEVRVRMTAAELSSSKACFPD